MNLREGLFRGAVTYRASHYAPINTTETPFSLVVVVWVVGDVARKVIGVEKENNQDKSVWGK